LNQTSLCSYCPADQVTIFARNTGFWALESVFSVFSERIRGGSHADLTDLTKIKLVSAKRARALFVSGFTSIEAVAAAEPHALIKYAMMRLNLMFV
jgi:DNA polymerase theta